MKTTFRSVALIAVALGLAFSAILFQDILIAVAFLVAVLTLFADFLWLVIVTRRPTAWFKISNQSEKTEILYPGQSASEKFLFEKKGSGSVSMSSYEPFLRLTPGMISRQEHSIEVLMEFKSPYAGEYVVRKMKLSVYGPLRLFVKECDLPLPTMKYRVRPSVIQVGIASAKILGKTGIGETPMNEPGIGTEFYEMRNYQPGDDYRQINWKATARRGELIVNEHMKEVGGSYYLVLEARAQDYFDRDRLATAFLQLANSLTTLRISFGVIIHDGEKVVAFRQIGFPEDSLVFVLHTAFDFAEVKKRDLYEEELTGIASYAFRANEELMLSEGFGLLSEIEKSGRLNLKRKLNSEVVFQSILRLVGERGSDSPAVLYVSGTFGSINQIVELGSELRRRYSAEFILINPTKPWVVAPDEIEAYEQYKKFQGKLRAFSLSNIEYSVGEPAAIASSVLGT